MSDIVICAQGLGKKYFIGHEVKSERYTALRDVLTRAAKGFTRSAVHLLRGRELIAGDEVEEFWALKDVSFEVKRGEVTGIIGSNGAGKSTLLKILSRITEPTEGRVQIKGRVASLLEVGTGFHPELTGRENIYLNGAILGMSKTEVRRKFDEIVAFAEVEKFIDTPVKRFSSGMYVRLAFAVAAHLEPEILVVDEVLAVGDADFQKKCLGKLQSVAGHGRTVLFVSHQLNSVRSLCSNAFLLKEGKIVLSGTASDVTDHYISNMIRSDLLYYSTSTTQRVDGTDLRAIVTALTINNNQPLLHGKPATFVLEYRAAESISGVAFALGFCSFDGVRIMTIDSDIPGPTFDLKKGERGRVEIRIDSLHLEPANYRLDIGIRSGGSSMIDYIAGLCSLTVCPSNHTPTVIAMRSAGHGGVRYPCEAILQKL